MSTADTAETTATAAGGGRARRTTTKKVDYAKEQEFSDEDVFEDSEPEEPTSRRGRAGGGGGRVRSGGGTRKSSKQSAATSSSVATSFTATTTDELDNDDDDENRIVYTEKGYDPSMPPLRERFPFLPEFEEDGSPKIELIVGRRPVDEKGKKDEAPADDVRDATTDEGATHDENQQDDDDEHEEAPVSKRKTRRSRKTDGKKKASQPPPDKKEEPSSSGLVEYEYLIKYKGRSYLHLEWKSGADLESMNKSAKGLYRRYLKKLTGGADDDLENPEVDPSFVVPEKILDEAEQEITIELTDEELLKWEKQREKELAEEEDDDDEDDKSKTSKSPKKIPSDGAAPTEEKEKSDSTEAHDEKDDFDWDADDLDFSSLSLDKLRAIARRDGPYYPIVEGSDNPYRDGYVTEPPKKPRASYLFFQCTVRAFYQKKHPGATQAELMTILGDKWRTMADEEREPFLQLAKEEAEQYDKERTLLEKAQKPNEVWQPIRRCRMVLERVMSDSFADIFLEPVDTNDFPDYEDVIDSPMDLGTVQKKIGTKKYQAPEQFARDMRKVWNNCKIFNQHGSAIWHVADYMSKQFERLYHSWVMEFRERYIRWTDPRARPWEHTCRHHDGSCKTPDDQMVLCDHCDAMYGFNCVDPPIKKAPSKGWHCPDCRPKLKSSKGVRMLSAVAENAARKRAELGDLPKKKTKQIMYLVKWAGLGYEFCTWETKEDINENRLIESYQKLNNTFPDEPDLQAEALHDFLDGVKHIDVDRAGGVACIPALRTQLYAQSRAFQFVKFGMELPSLVRSECGPKTTAIRQGRQDEPSVHEEDARTQVHSKRHPKEVIECVYDLVFKVARDEPSNTVGSNSLLPPLMTGEYDAIVPITAKGLMMNVGEIHGSVAFLGYRQFPDGSKGPAELANLIKRVGDKIIAVDGVSTVGKSFKQVIMMLRESGKNKYAFMRFLENRYAVCDNDLASVGLKGRYAIDQMKEKFVADRQRLIVHRKQQLSEGQEEKKPETKQEEEEKEEGSDAESDDGSEGEFQPDSGDEDDDAQDGSDQEADSGDAEPAASASQDKKMSREDKKETPPSKEDKKDTGDVDSRKVMNSGSPKTEAGNKLGGVLCRHETTRSLGARLLNLDLGYSSDEGGDDDCAYFLDGVDETFTGASDVEKTEAANDKRKGGNHEDENATLPAKQKEFSAHGDRGKLAVAMALTPQPPQIEDFDNFPFPSSKEIEANRKKAEEEEEEKRESQLPSPAKSTKRSTVKVEQVSLATGEAIHVWASIEAAAATLQLPLNELKQVLRGEYDEEIGDEVGGFRWRYALAGAKVTAGNASSGRGGGGKKAKEAWLEFREKLYDPNEPHSYKNGNRLRDYQVDGVNWLASTWYKRQGCILADEMGLGKTVQIVCFIEHLFRVEKIQRPYLVVVPLSTVEHWRREFEGWTDMVCCVYHDRQRIWRDVLREYEWYYEHRPHTADFLKFDVMVTTYDTLISDFDVVSQIPFRVAVVDEAHRLRNQKGKLLECMREISARGTMQHGFQSRVLMSGTPLQNDLTELWTLLNFIEPFKFPDLDHFQASFGNMANRSQVERLQSMISPFMLRRVKEDVAKDIPSKEETVIDVELTSVQKQYYRAIFEHNHAFLSIGATRQTAPKLMNIQMELRKVCNHPFLLEGVEQRESERQYKDFVENGSFEGKSPEEQQNMVNEHGYIMTSGKMVLLDKLLPKLRQEGHKILIFSQMVKMLDLISEYCEFRNFRYERLDGRVRGTDRQKSIDRFEREADSFLFLLSTRAGGVGINLTAADICIIFDSDWNPQNDVQAQARCHRIGQTKDVRIYRLVTSRSFEQEMFDRASKKLGLEQAVLGTFEKDRDDDKPTEQEMEQLLKKGAYALLEDENDEITKEFCADDIESILAKRTRTRVVEGTKTASWLNKQGMVVSKSKFSAETGEDTLDMDDPLFWQKVMPDFVTPGLMLQKLNDLQDEIEGKSRRGKRGRGRPKKKQPEEEDDDGTEKAGADDTAATDNANAGNEPNGDEDDGNKVDNDEAKDDDNSAEAADTQEDPSDDDSENETAKGKKAKIQLSRSNIKKVHKFMSDLKSMMEGIFEDADDEGLSSDEKDVCQKLLLTISVKDKIFNDDQRHLAKIFLKRIEGDRRRRCRTSEQAPRFTPGGHDEEPTNTIPEQLLIAGKKRKKRKKREEVEEDDPEPRKSKRRGTDNGGDYVGEDGYLHHSDSEADWSDVGEDIYAAAAKKKDGISRKEARRRRQWAADEDTATAAGLNWPVFPRHLVRKVLTTVLEEVIKHDESHGGAFSSPVPKEDFPDYYDRIKKPMDYSTMKTKLENGEYRSAQAMQKDFILIVANCRTYNDTSSDIVKEAREQHLMRPKILKEAATKHDIFLAEDGTVLEIFDEEKGSPKKRGRKRKNGSQDEDEAERTNEETPAPRKKGKKRKGSVDEDVDVEAAEKEVEDTRPKKKLRKSKKKDSDAEDDEETVEAEENDDDDELSTKVKPRIRIKVKGDSNGDPEAEKGTKGKKKPPRRKKNNHNNEMENGDASTKGTDAAGPAPKKKPKKGDAQPKKKKGKKSQVKADAAPKEESSQEDEEKVEAEEAKKTGNPIFWDPSFWKRERGSLDGSFDAARSHLTRYGPWELPDSISDDMFTEIARTTLVKMDRHDRYSVFADAVTDEEAPDYSKTVKHPMDFGTMKEKVAKGQYGVDSGAEGELFRDFLLVFDNCRLYNKEDSEVTEEASRVLALLPETFAAACQTVMSKR